jgi:hypothetical protein
MVASCKGRIAAAAAEAAAHSHGVQFLLAKKSVDHQLHWLRYAS